MVEVYEVEVVTRGLKVLNIFSKEIFTPDFVKQTSFSKSFSHELDALPCWLFVLPCWKLHIPLGFPVHFTSNWSQKMHYLGKIEHADACVVFDF